MSALKHFVKRLTRRKCIKDDDMGKSHLKRCLTTLDLTALGVGSTLGAGAYVLAGQVAKEQAGPSVVISFLLAAIASILAGLCYSEFGARVPKAGSAYVYTYVTVGEIMAFVIGWNLILEYVIGAASVARTASGYVDNLIGDVLVPWFNKTMPMNVPTLTPYFDLLSLGVTLLLTVLLAVGVKESVMFTKIFTGVNLSILTYIIVVGSFSDNPDNWSLPAESIPNTTDLCGEGTPSCGVGGFAPYGIAGITRGAATCFFAFVGFDGIAAAGEEAANPQKSIPIATIVSLGIVFVVYFGISLTITMMTPYYKLSMKAPFATVFEEAGYHVSKYIVSIGAMCALSVSLLCVMFPMPRIAFAMANDGLLFKVFASISERFKTPMFSTIATGLIAAVMAALFETKDLVDMMSIGTLLAYTLVSASVLLLRYDTFPEDVAFSRNLLDNRAEPSHEADKMSRCSGAIYSPNPSSLVQKVAQNYKNVWESPKSVLFKILHPTYSSCATPFSANVVKILSGILSFWIVACCMIAHFYSNSIFVDANPISILSFATCLIFIIALLILIDKQPQSLRKLSFTVPLVPYFPAASMLFNIFLMINLDLMTWVRFSIWMVLGFAIYFGYGMWHSQEEQSYLVEAAKYSEDNHQYHTSMTPGHPDQPGNLQMTDMH